MNYWKIKSATLERTMRLEQLQAEALKIDAAYKALMAGEGLDATKNYRLIDADESVTLDPPEPKLPLEL